MVITNRSKRAAELLDCRRVLDVAALYAERVALWVDERHPSGATRSAPVIDRSGAEANESPTS